MGHIGPSIESIPSLIMVAMPHDVPHIYVLRAYEASSIRGELPEKWGPDILKWVWVNICTPNHTFCSLSVMGGKTW